MKSTERNDQSKLHNMDEILHQISCMDLAEDEAELAKTIPPLLKSIGNYTGADRVYVFDWSSDDTHTSLSNTFEWCAPGVKPEIQNLQAIPISLMPSWMEAFWNQKTIVIPDLERIAQSTPQEYAFLKQQGIHSVIALPIYASHNLSGFIGLDNPDLTDGQLSVKLLSDIGGHLGSVRENMRMIRMLERKQADLQNSVEALKQNQQKLQKALEAEVSQNEIISAISKIYHLIYLLDLTNDTYQELSNQQANASLSSDPVNPNRSIWHAASFGTGITDLFAILKKTIVSPEFDVPVSDFINMATLGTRLAHTDTISMEYKTRFGSWHLGRFIVKSRNEAGIVTSVLYVAYEITEQKRLELEYRERLMQSMEEAKRANTAKTTFLSNMSHDIRTPMNAIIGFTNIALKYSAPPEIKNCLEKIEQSSEHLLALINDVLDISRIESGMVKYEPVPTNIHQVTDSVLNIMKGFLANRNLNFHLNRNTLDTPYVMADAVRIREILVNILSNAVKFTEDGGTISMEASSRPGQDSQQIMIRYRVSDTGIGMSEEFQKKLFDDFTQEHSGARTNYKGTGLGMSITKRYVELMNGTITVQSKKGCGTTFTVELPLMLAKKEQISDPVLPDQLPDLHQVPILLAEDNDLNAEIATIQLEEAGLCITRVSNGSEAVQCFSDHPAGTFALILMDVMMPEMDGYTATRRIRSLPNRPDGKTIPIIAMTANAFAEDIQASIHAGMNDHIPKPLSMNQVLKIIAKNIRPSQ